MLKFRFLRPGCVVERPLVAEAACDTLVVYEKVKSAHLGILFFHSAP